MNRSAPAARLALLVTASLLGFGFAAPQVTNGATPTDTQLVGQKLMVAMSGTTPTTALLGRIRRGEVGGVILFGSNIVDAAQLRALSTSLRAAAAAGGQPPLLISTDQEGGAIKRIPWAPPTLSVQAMTAAGSTTAFAQGKATGAILACAGINNDLAPVADVPSSTSSFMYQQGRTWSFSASTTATMSASFAAGLVAGSDVPAMKHFPGIGQATQNTDDHAVTITASRTTLAPGLLPYEKAIAAGIPMVMLSNATYTAYDAANAAGWSHAISVDLLRTQLGFTGVSITDSLTGTAAAHGVSASTLAVRAARAGTDMLLLTGSEASTASTFAKLLEKLQAGTISRSTLETSYARILALKATLDPPPADSTPPAVTTPLTRLLSGTTLSSSTVAVRTTASLTDPCGISSRSLQRRQSGGAFQTDALPAGTSISKSERLAIGLAYQFAARATDGAGNRSGWQYGGWHMPVLTQQSSSAVAYGGTWYATGNSYASGGSLRYSTAAGASATFTFTGSSVAWVAMRSPVRGSAKVYVDGLYRTTVNLYASANAPAPRLCLVGYRHAGRANAQARRRASCA
jgi:beta-N-acetylhexosaminidase